MKTNFKQLTQEELIRFIESLGQRPYRAKQIINWIYKKLVTSFDEMTDLPKELRRELTEKAFIGNLHLQQKQTSMDGTEKFLFKLEDGETIESVLIPNSRGKNSFTLCISSQVGCAMGCKFCMTGKLGLKRNLQAYEIIDQVISVKRYIQSKSGCPAHSITNIVFMGMGEPLNNIKEVIHALYIITDIMGFSKRKVTVSTAGIIPGIYELAEKGPRVNLAISLNASSDEIRNKIMPVNKKYPLGRLLEACRKFPLLPNRHITFEYVLISGINDSREDAFRLSKLLRGIKSKINLIPYNPLPATTFRKSLSNEFKSPPEKDILVFQKILKKAGITATLRKSKGVDISAACGQLKASYFNSTRRLPAS
jgi:23S rRNA (adenine2503-C2)-methyltransferase